MASILNADNGVVSGSAGLKSNADSTGVLALQSNGATALSVGTDLNLTMTNATVNGVLYANGSKVLSSGSALNFDGTNLQIGTTTNTNSSKLVVNGTISQTVSGTQYQLVDQSDIGTAPNEIPLNQYLGSMAYQDSSAYYNTGITTGFRNRFINGNMRIDQRNANASINLGTSTFCADRWVGYNNDSTGVIASQVVTDAPTNAGFVNSVKLTVSTAIPSYSTAIACFFRQTIEGNNVADFAWGTSSAKSFTLSFWVKSSLTGTFGGTAQSGDSNRTYGFTYVISKANTWEQKIINIAGDTSGTWYTDNRAGLIVNFSHGVGTSRTVSTTGAWVNQFLGWQPTGTVLLASTVGATWNITGVQLEMGDTATSFDVRPYGTELALCQRYYVRYTSLGNESLNQSFLIGVVSASTTGNVCGVNFANPMRTTPTGSYSNVRIYDGTAVPSVTSIASQSSSATTGSLILTASGGGLTIGRSATIISNGPTLSFVDFSAEL